MLLLAIIVYALVPGIASAITALTIIFCLLTPLVAILALVYSLGGVVLAIMKFAGKEIE